MAEESSENDEVEYKIITLGNTGVGKTSIIQRFVLDEYNPDQLSTMGCAFSFKVLNINKKTLKLKLIDTGGQERYRSLSLNYFKNADVVLFVFDLNLEESFDSIQYWIDLFNNNDGGQHIIGKYLIGNKCDLEQKVKQELIDEIVQKNGLLYMSTSARTKSQIDEMFEYIGADLYEYTEKKAKKQNGKKKVQKGKVHTKTNLNKQKKGNCCN